MPRRPFVMVTCLLVLVGVPLQGVRASSAAGLQIVGPQTSVARNSEDGGNIDAYGLEDGRTYILSSDEATFDKLGSHQVSVAWQLNRAPRIHWNVDPDTPASVTAVHFSLSLDGSEVAQADEPFSLPGAVITACPQQTQDFPTSEEFNGFLKAGLPNGHFRFTSAKGVFQPDTLEVVQGTPSAAKVTWNADAYGTFTVTATSIEQPDVSFTLTGALAESEEDNYPGYDPWTISPRETCFAPSEPLTLLGATGSVSQLAGATADRTGVASPVIHVRVGAAPVDLHLTLVGTRSGQSVPLTLVPIPGSTLASGQAVTGYSDDLRYDEALVSVGSHAPAYSFSISSCEPVIFHFMVHGGDGVGLPGDHRAGATQRCTMRMQTDGNLVLYSSQNKVIWTTDTGTLGVRNRLVMQTDGNAVMYSATNAPVWSSKSGLHALPGLAAGQELSNGQHVSNGNVAFGLSAGSEVFVQRAGVVIWRAHTAGLLGRRLVMQTDGNLVLYRGDGKAVWSTHTSGRGGTHLSVLANGDVAVRTARNATVWHTNTSMR